MLAEALEIALAGVMVEEVEVIGAMKDMEADEEEATTAHREVGIDPTIHRIETIDDMMIIQAVDGDQGHLLKTTRKMLIIDMIDQATIFIQGDN